MSSHKHNHPPHHHHKSAAEQAKEKLRKELLELARQFLEANPVCAMMPYSRECCGDRSVHIDITYSAVRAKIGSCVTEQQFNEVMHVVNEYLGKLNTGCKICTCAMLGLFTFFIPLCCIMCEESNTKDELRKYLISVNNGVAKSTSTTSSSSSTLTEQTQPLITSSSSPVMLASAPPAYTPLGPSPASVVVPSLRAQWELNDLLSVVLVRVPPQTVEQKWASSICEAEVTRLMNAYRDTSGGSNVLGLVEAAAVLGASGAAMAQLRSGMPQSMQPTVIVQPVYVMQQAPQQIAYAPVQTIPVSVAPPQVEGMQAQPQPVYYPQATATVMMPSAPLAPSAPTNTTSYQQEGHIAP